MAGILCNVLGCGKDTVTTIIELVGKAKENDELCYRIVERAEALKPLLNRLSQLQATSTQQPSTIEHAIRSLQLHLEKCETFMTKLDERLLAQSRDYLQSSSCHVQLQGLYDELNAATETLNLAVSTENSFHIEDLQQLVRREVAYIRQDIVNPHAGVYLTESPIPRPHSAVVVTARAEYDCELQESFLVISWRDKGNNTDIVTHFEVQYNQERGQSVPWPATQGSGIRLGKEKVQPGMPYTVCVRKINESGPGPWSEPIVVHIPAGAPSQPLKPSIKLTSPTEGTLTVRRLSREEEHGSPVKAVIIESCIQPSEQWIPREVEVNPSLSCLIEAAVSVEPGTTQYFRVKMRNSAGISAPSEIFELTPSQMIPGPPQNITVVGRTATEIKLRWCQPAINPHAAVKYELQKRTRREGWETISTTEQLLAVAAGLKPNTKYWFRVCAVNSDNAKGAFGNDVEDETKFSERARNITVGLAAFGALALPNITAGAVCINHARKWRNHSTEEKIRAYITGGAEIAVGILTLPLQPILMGPLTATVSKICDLPDWKDIVDAQLAPDKIADN